jgi:hypothetical protein
MKHMSLCATRFVCSTTLHRALLLAIAMVLLLPAAPAQADIGPKPGMAFAFEYQIPKTPIVSAQMLECQDAECKTSTPLQQMGPHGLRCNEYDCRSTAYGYAPYHKLVVTFAFPQLALPVALALGLAELFAVAFETGFVYAFTHWGMPFRHALSLSALMNAASFAIGLVAVWGGLL